MVLSFILEHLDRLQKGQKLQDKKNNFFRLSWHKIDERRRQLRLTTRHPCFTGQIEL